MEEMIFQQRDSEMSYKKGHGLRMVYDSTRYAIVTTRVPFVLSFLGYHAQGSSPWTKSNLLGLQVIRDPAVLRRCSTLGLASWLQLTGLVGLKNLHYICMKGLVYCVTVHIVAVDDCLTGSAN